MNSISAAPPHSNAVGSGLKPFKNTSGLLGMLFNEPAAPDGLTNKEAAPISQSPPHDHILQSLYQQIKKGTLGTDVTTLLSLAIQGTKTIDDRQLLLDKIIVMLQALGTSSPLANTFTGGLIKVLWQDLQHPPAAFVGNKFRSADGSGNNLFLPSLGQSGQPYARTVSPLHPMPHNLPDPGLVFDALLKRDKFTPHPSGISSLLFAFATVIIHSIFQTSRTDYSINEASSYLDLSPLYGNNQEEQITVRTFSQGMLYPDVVASSRLFLMPPAVVALLVVFNRNHNYIAQRLFQINERGKFKPLDKLDEAGKKIQDEELFQTSRLINCGFFLDVVFMDYIRVILNVNRTDSTWALIPTGEIKTLLTGKVPEGGGNACSVEFNLLYRWHSSISEQDDKWLQGQIRRFTLKPFHQLDENDLRKIMEGLDHGADPRKWNLDNYARQASGYFRDEDIAKILTEATKNVAGAFGAKGTPACMRVIDVLGIAMARNDWNTCSLNEFRKFLGLKTYSTFEEWNPDPEISKIARQLYVHPDNIELYVGMHAEQAKPSQAGSGLAPGYTISRAILSDAVALTRGDRHYTTDYNIASLTAWGLEDTTPDVEGGSFGGVMGKLLMRTLPNAYTYNSIYALFPFSTPETTKKILTDLKLDSKYNFDLPKVTKGFEPVKSYLGVNHVLADHKAFGVIYADNIKTLLAESFFIAIDDPKLHLAQREVMDRAMYYPGWEKDVAYFYRSTTGRLIQEHRWSYDGGRTYCLDVVRDVINIAPVLWCAETFGVPLRTPQHPVGIMTPQEFYGVLATCFAFIFLNFDPSQGFKLRTNAIKAVKVLQLVVDTRFKEVVGFGSLVEGFARLLFKGKDLIGMSAASRAFYKRVLASGRPAEELKAACCAMMTASTSNVAHMASQMINFYLNPYQKAHYREIVRLVKENTVTADAKLMGFVYEAMRLEPQAPLVPRRANFECSVDDGDFGSKAFKKNDLVFASLKDLNMDPSIFKEPQTVDPYRNRALYKSFSTGMHICLGDRLTEVAMLQIIKEVFKLKNVRFAQPKAGLYRFMNDFCETQVPLYVTSTSTLSPYPVSLPIAYDA